jgi:hypothetical protein
MAAVQSSPYCKWHSAQIAYQLALKRQLAGDPTAGYYATSSDGWKTTTVRKMGIAPNPGPPPGPPPPGGCSSGSLVDKLVPLAVFGGGVASFVVPLASGGAALAGSGSGVASLAPAAPAVVAPVTLPSFSAIGASVLGGLKTALGAAGLVKSLTGSLKAPSHSSAALPGTVQDGTDASFLGSSGMSTALVVAAGAAAVAGLIYWSKRR